MVLPIMISLMPSIIGMLLAFLWNGGRSGASTCIHFSYILQNLFIQGVSSIVWEGPLQDLQ